MANEPAEVEQLAALAAAKEVIRRAVLEAALGPEIAAAACAELAGEYAAALAAERDLAPSPLLDEVARTMRRRGAAVHHWLSSGQPTGNGRNPS